MKLKNFNKKSLSGSLKDFESLIGNDIINRVKPYHDWLNLRRENKVWPYSKILNSSPEDQVKYTNEFGNLEYKGINFAIQDYLSLTKHPKVHEAAIDIINKFGPHSAGSPILAGNSLESKKLERNISSTLKTKDSILYATGWGAGFGVIQGLIRPHDYIIIDKYAHACLRTGTLTSTKNIHKFDHNSHSGLMEALSKIRSKDKKNGILVITEGLFSMDSDYPNIIELQETCHKYDARLLVDVAHDFGSMGPNGSGTLGIQNILGKIDLIMGSFSKTFACNGGFVACSSEVKDYLSIYSSPYTFSNAISPIQCAIANKCFGIIQSSEGEKIRNNLMKNIKQLRKGFEDEKMEVYGTPSPIVPVITGDEKIARITSRLLNESSLLANLVEYPAVPIGKSRFRFQVMSSHTPEECDEAVEIFMTCFDEACRIVKNI